MAVAGSAPHPAEAQEFADERVRAAGEWRPGWPAPLAPVTVPLEADRALNGHSE